MDPSLILSFIPVVTIGTMLKFNGDNNGHGLKTLRVKRPLVSMIIFTQPGLQFIVTTVRYKCTYSVPTTE